MKALTTENKIFSQAKNNVIHYLVLVEEEIEEATNKPPFAIASLQSNRPLIPSAQADGDFVPIQHSNKDRQVSTENLPSVSPPQQQQSQPEIKINTIHDKNTEPAGKNAQTEIGDSNNGAFSIYSSRISVGQNGGGSVGRSDLRRSLYHPYARCSPSRKEHAVASEEEQQRHGRQQHQHQQTPLLDLPNQGQPQNHPPGHHHHNDHQHQYPQHQNQHQQQFHNDTQQTNSHDHIPTSMQSLHQQDVQSCNVAQPLVSPQTNLQPPLHSNHHNEVSGESGQQTSDLQCRGDGVTPKLAEGSADEMHNDDDNHQHYHQVEPSPHVVNQDTRSGQTEASALAEAEPMDVENAVDATTTTEAAAAKTSSESTSTTKTTSPLFDFPAFDFDNDGYCANDNNDDPVELLSVEELETIINSAIEVSIGGPSSSLAPPTDGLQQQPLIQPQLTIGDHRIQQQQQHQQQKPQKQQRPVSVPLGGDNDDGNSFPDLLRREWPGFQISKHQDIVNFSKKFQEEHKIHLENRSKFAVPIPKELQDTYLNVIHQYYGTNLDVLYPQAATATTIAAGAAVPAAMNNSVLGEVDGNGVDKEVGDEMGFYQLLFANSPNTDSVERPHILLPDSAGATTAAAPGNTTTIASTAQNSQKTIPWYDLVLKKWPNFNLEKTTKAAKFIRDFLHTHRLTRLMMKCSDRRFFQAIPGRLRDTFMTDFESVFARELGLQQSRESSRESPNRQTAAQEENEGPPDGSVAWTDLIRRKWPHFNCKKTVVVAIHTRRFCIRENIYNRMPARIKNDGRGKSAAYAIPAELQDVYLREIEKLYGKILDAIPPPPEENEFIPGPDDLSWSDLVRLKYPRFQPKFHAYLRNFVHRYANRNLLIGQKVDGFKVAQLIIPHDLQESFMRKIDQLYGQDLDKFYQSSTDKNEADVMIGNSSVRMDVDGNPAESTDGNESAVSSTTVMKKRPNSRRKGKAMERSTEVTLEIAVDATATNTKRKGRTLIQSAEVHTDLVSNASATDPVDATAAASEVDNAVEADAAEMEAENTAADAFCEATEDVESEESYRPKKRGRKPRNEFVSMPARQGRRDTKPRNVVTAVRASSRRSR